MSARYSSELPPLPQSPTVEYRHCPGFPGYCVGSDGSVWSCKHSGPWARWRHAFKKMEPQIDKKGYPRVQLRINGKHANRRVHKLVLEAFVGPCPHGHQCRHFPDPTRTNNALNNLSWGTHEDNMRDRTAHGSTARCGVRGVRNPKGKLTDEQVRQIREMHKTIKNKSAIAREFGITSGYVCKLLTGEFRKEA